MITYQPKQNIVESDARILVNTVNVVGVMGKGVALAFKQKFPEIMPRYMEACDGKKIAPGTFQVLPTDDGRNIINLATKDHWRDPSRYEWVGTGLIYLNRFLTSRLKEPASLCMPMPGAGNGGLEAARVQQMIRIYMYPQLARGLDLRLCAGELSEIDDPVYFAGVGARKTPGKILNLMEEVGALLTEDGMRLRSGGAIGADTAFYNGAKEVDPDLMEIFLAKPKPGIIGAVTEISPVFGRLARNFHPKPQAITPTHDNDRRQNAFKLMSRNGCQVFGADFTIPSNVIICWTPEGKGQGGTGQAIRLANTAGIPVIDLGRPDLQGISARDVRDMTRAAVAGFRKSRNLPEFLPKIDAGEAFPTGVGSNAC
ncbi:macro domain-containing protein [Pseudosulfitobacter pseudonitzschiae]|uniref:macro domain-containing protein n=1 Tax=Pseudosulfitobacter pseudonitzschiae TaxID=1402135 RepID=UPI003B793660